jgi:hypothetical protein
LAKALAADEAPKPSPASAPAPAPPAPTSSSGSRGADRRLTDEVRQELKKEVLARFDKNHDGKLDSEERRAVFQYIRESRYLRYFDANLNGQLDRDEYAPLIAFLDELQ